MAHLSFSSFPLAQQTTPAQLAPLPSRGPSNRQSGPVRPASLAMAQPRARSASTSPRHAWPHLPAPPRARPAQRRARVPLSRCVPGPHATRVARPTCRSHPPAAPRSGRARPTPPLFLTDRAGPRVSSTPFLAQRLRSSRRLSRRDPPRQVRTPRPPPPYKKGPQPLPYPSPSPPPPVNPSAPPPCCSAAPLLCIAAVSPPCRSTARHDPRNSSAVCPGPTPSTLPPIPDPAIDGIAWILSPVRSLAPPRFHPAGAVRPELTPVLAS